MRSPVTAFRSRPVFNVAFVVLVAGMSAACSNSLRLQEPFFTGSTENQREILGSADQSSAYQQPMPQIATTDNSVSRTSLPPPASAYASTDQGDDYGAPMAASAGAYEWSAVGGRVITVRANDSLDTLTAQYGVPGDQILNANQLHSAADIRAGRVIVIPKRVPIAADRLQDPDAPAVAYAAPTAPAAPAMPAMPAKPGAMLAANTVGASTYTVMSGDTLFSVARKTGMTPSDLASLNGLTLESQLQIGQTLRLKGDVAKPLAVAAATPPKQQVLGAPPKPLGQLVVSQNGTPANPPTLRPTTTTGTDDTQLAMNTAPATPAVSTDTALAATDASLGNTDVADAPSADGTSFRWPVRGRIIAGFGTKPNGEKNDGINLAVPAGTSVKAVEAGTVIYAGNELAGYGNLVLIRHADGWVSAYAHNQDLLVKRGDVVKRGQIIAHAGMTGSVTSPQVHFELRKGAKPVNPLDYLAGA
ncbi:MAG TPA: LysM peptidoglycan-binding domain-containing M23 family metallopeptidase [Bauldia sp.]|nr:LysM peptidoglycan-binding domain-containing M23 family metallopeptidase [Bauldia sp.]